MGFFPVLPANPLGTPPGSGSWTSFVSSVLAPSITTTSGPWRPPQFNKKQLTSLVATLPSGGNNASGVTGSGANSSTPTTYFFDAILRVEHDQELKFTEHPVQSGASIVDHAYLMPARVTLEIGMSDVMAAFSSGLFTSDKSKSISAYKTLKQLQSLRIPLTLNTRLDTYKNLLIANIRAIDDNRTSHGLRALVVFSQIRVASVAVVTTSSRPDQSGNTDEGTKNPTNVPPDVQNLINSTTPTSDPFHH